MSRPSSNCGWPNLVPPAPVGGSTGPALLVFLFAFLFLFVWLWCAQGGAGDPMALEGGRDELQAKLQATEAQLREKSERVSQLEQRVEVRVLVCPWRVQGMSKHCISVLYPLYCLSTELYAWI